MQKRQWTALLAALVMLFTLLPFPVACAEEENHFENTAKVMFYDERGSLPPREFLIEIRGSAEGEGTPTPDAPIPITGFRECRVMHLGENEMEPAVITARFPEEAGLVFGGVYDALHGRLTVTRAGVRVERVEDLSSLNTDRGLAVVKLPGISGEPLNEPEELETLRCDRLKTLGTWATWDEHDLFISKVNGAAEAGIKNKEAFSSRDSADAWLAENPLTISYALPEPMEYYMDCVPLLSYRGANVVWADTGKIQSFTCRAPQALAEPVRPALRILAFGNSFTYSTLNYMPAILEELMPETEIVMGVCYDPGCTLERHTVKYLGGDGEREIPPEYQRYSEYRRTVGKWVVSPDPATAKDALGRYDWDIIILQQSVENLQDFESLCDFAELITEKLPQPALLVYNMAQARAPGDPWLDVRAEGESALDRSNDHFRMIAEYAEKALETPYISAVLPGGTAVQNLRSCSFAAETGDYGYFAKDAGGHLQEGIAPLAAGYAAACRIAELCRELPGLYGLRFLPSEQWAEETETPDWKTYVPFVGMSPENIKMAKKCAMMALKNPYTVTDCSVWERELPEAPEGEGLTAETPAA